jgi:FG-GAP repeat protein
MSRARRLALPLLLGLVTAAWLAAVPVAASTHVEPSKAHPRLHSRGTFPTRGKAPLALHGDFNGDGYADAAIGVSLKDVHGQVDAGAVSVIYGSASGLTIAGNQLLTQDTPGALDRAEAGDEFGRYMGGGDFNSDGYFDLAVGVPEENLTINGQDVDNAGAVQIFYGSHRAWRDFSALLRDRGLRS